MADCAGLHAAGWWLNVAMLRWIGNCFTNPDLGCAMQNTDSADFKGEAHRLIEALPSNASWDDLMYRVYVRQCIDAGIADADAGRVVDVAEVRRRFGLAP